MLKNLFRRKDKNQEVPTSIKKYNIRVSNPYGLYPQDVESVIIDLEKERAKLQSLVKQYKEENEKLQKDNEDLKTTITQLRFDMSLFEVPDSTNAQDFQNINKLKKLKNKKVEVSDDTGLEVVELWKKTH